jgi:hypothetical protein
MSLAYGVLVGERDICGYKLHTIYPKLCDSEREVDRKFDQSLLIRDGLYD